MVVNCTAYLNYGGANYIFPTQRERGCYPRFRALPFIESDVKHIRMISASKNVMTAIGISVVHLIYLTI